MSEAGEALIEVVRDRGHMEPTTWGQVELGNIVRDQKDMLHTVVHMDAETVTIQAARGGEPVRMYRPDAARPVMIYVPSELECISLLDKELGARVLVDVEAREHTLARIPFFRVDPIARTAEALKDHVAWMHGVELQDQLNEYARVKKKRATTPAAKAEKAEALAAVLNEMCEAHDEFHADAAAWPMPMPHHHALED